MKSLYSLGKELASQTDSFTKVLYRENLTVTFLTPYFTGGGKKQSGKERNAHT